MARGELGNATREALADVGGPETLACRAFVGSFSASISKAIFAQLLVRHRMIPPFVSVGGCVDQVRFFDADAEAAPRCAAGDESARVAAKKRRAAEIAFAETQFRRSHKEPPACAAKLLGAKGILQVSGADAGAAAATVFFTYVVNHVLYADHHRLLPWVYLGWREVPLVYDPEKHTSPHGIWTYYFEPLENVALYERGRHAADDVKAGRRACPAVDCAAPRTCRDATVVVKKGDWRHRVHRKASWAVRAWYVRPSFVFDAPSLVRARFL